MTLPKTFEITLDTDQVAGALVILVVKLAIPFVFGAIAGKVGKAPPVGGSWRRWSGTGRCLA